MQFLRKKTQILPQKKLFFQNLKLYNLLLIHIIKQVLKKKKIQSSQW